MRHTIIALVICLSTAYSAFSQSGCTTNCVITNPTSSQSVTQPSGTALDINYFNNQIANGIYYPLRYSGGDLCAQMAAAIAAMPAAGGTLDIEGLSSVSPATCSSNPFASVTKPLSVRIGPGKINTTAQWYAHSSFFHLQGAGMGNTQLLYTGTTPLKDPGGTNPGGVLELDSPTPATTYNYGDSVSDMSVIGNANAPYAMLVDGTHHSQFRNLSLWGSATCDYESKFAVVDDLDNIHSSNGDASFFGFPGSESPNGMCLDGEGPGGSTTAATVTNPILENHPHCGIELTYVSNMTFLSGTAEGNGTSGVPTSADVCIQVGTAGSAAIRNAFIGLDMEAPQNVDLLDYGSYNTFLDVLGVSATFAGTNANVQGGELAAVTIASTAQNTTIDKTLVANSVSDLGANSMVEATYSSNACGAACYTGVPWTYRNTIIGGGSVSGYGGMPPEDFLRGFFRFNAATETLLSNTKLISGKPWSAVLIGDWSTAINFGVAANAPITIVTSAAPSVVLNGGATVTFSLNSSEQLQAICSAGCSGSLQETFFQGSIFMVQSQNTIAAAFDINTPTGISTNVLKATTIEDGSGAEITKIGDIPQMKVTAAAGTCISNGYIPVTIHGTVLHVATCQ